MRDTAAFALLDCNNFYASSETVFNPKLKDPQLVIRSNNNGCSVNHSNAAKVMGLKGMRAWFQVQQR